ncbi:GTP 3',8-cyclase MoaA [Candidatus Bathyarchaeota archaeon A05DMB-2]|jgi:cyclic pyranopterin phosphate synthase|nr:GTP 3',8-cyclase MoaA [Candidatus Bathyarchaeota archaeon A05DMB-2]
MVLTDKCGRPLLNLRIAVTQRCNLRCDYCHKEGEELGQCSRGKAEEMTVDEITRIARIAISLGIDRIKLTGGEPLMRKDLCEIVTGIAAIPNLRELSLTTNGNLLGFQARELRQCGLKRVNISLPTLDAEVYHKLTGGRIEDALDGVKAAVAAGFYPVKLNMVVLKGVNGDAVPEMMDFARETGTILQLIELDPVNVDDAYFSVYHELLDANEEMLRQKAVSLENRPFMHNRHVYHLPDVTVEVVHPTENSEFCQHCTRLRVTSDGKLKPCLMRNDNLVDLLTPMRQGASDEELRALFIRVNERREPYNKNQ